jgi:cytochrome c oxidase cbb3-type subunit I/II
VAECWQCHGESGRGDGPSAPTLKDNTGLPISPADLTLPLRFKNGARPQDVYRTLMTGLIGTPMPSYADALEPEQAWDVIFYVLSLSETGRRLAESKGPMAPAEPAADHGGMSGEQGGRGGYRQL